MAFKTDQTGYYHEQDPNEKLDYTVDWTSWLAGPDGLGTDTIASSEWVVETPMVKSNESILTGSKKTQVFLDVGACVVGSEYDALNRITTVAGRIKEQAFRILVKEEK